MGRLPGAAILLVLGSCASLQAGAALAMRLFPVAGAPGATLLRLGLAAAVLLAVTRPRVLGWRAAQWRSVLLYGLSIAGTNATFYAALARLPLGTAVTIQFLGPLTLSAALSRRARDLGWVLLAASGVAVLGLADGHGGAGRPAGARRRRHRGRGEHRFGARRQDLSRTMPPPRACGERIRALATRPAAGNRGFLASCS